MIALIMAGGVGTRFWPASTNKLPKQFLPIIASKSMIRLTFERLMPLIESKDIYVVTAQDQSQLVKEHLPEMPPENIIIEPFGMNTAPCLALSLAHLQDRYPPDEKMIVLPADHYIRDTQKYLQSLELARSTADKELLISFGIQATYPATGYGYIEAGEDLSPGVRKMKRFKEKPELNMAISFLEQGNFYWNSGMFCWKLSTLKQAFLAHLPQALEKAVELIKARDELQNEQIQRQIYAQMPKVPIDIGIMEKASNRAVIPVDYGWSDVGSWQALSELSIKDEQGNSFQTSGLAIDAKDNYIHTQKFTALIGINELCIIESENAILVCPKERSEEVKAVVDKLKQEKKEELL